MLTKLLDISGNTPVAQLPVILNFNNKCIKEEIDNLYDAESDYLTKSVYAPVGKVKAYNGEFTTLTLEHLILRSPDALADVVKDTVKIVPHNLMLDRYSSTDVSNSMGISTTQTKYTFCHDASTIIMPNFYTRAHGVLTVDDDYYTVYNVLDSVVKEISALKTAIFNTAQLSSMMQGQTMTASTFAAAPRMASVMSLSDDMEINAAADESPVVEQAVTYPESYMLSTTVMLRRIGVPKLHIDDLITGHQYTYYNVTTPQLIINNEHVSALDCQLNGTVVNIALDKTVDNKEFKILLDRKEKKYLVIETPRAALSRLQLICTQAYNDQTGSVWDLYNYSLPNASNSKIDIITED